MAKLSGTLEILHVWLLSCKKPHLGSEMKNVFIFFLFVALIYTVLNTIWKSKLFFISLLPFRQWNRKILYLFSNISIIVLYFNIKIKTTTCFFCFLILDSEEKIMSKRYTHICPQVLFVLKLITVTHVDFRQIFPRGLFRIGLCDLYCGPFSGSNLTDINRNQSTVVHQHVSVMCVHVCCYLCLSLGIMTVTVWMLACCYFLQIQFKSSYRGFHSVCAYSVCCVSVYVCV